MHSVIKFFNLLVASVGLGLVCLTSGCEVEKVPVATPHVLSVSTSWQPSTRSGVLFINNTNEFVCEEAQHTQELSPVSVFVFHLYYSLSSSLGALQLVFFKSDSKSGAAIEESSHWMHYDIRDTILISAGLCFCTASLVGFISWIRLARRPSCSVHTGATGREFHPRILRSSTDGHAESSFDRWVGPGDRFPHVTESHTAQVSEVLDIDLSNPLLPTREISATKTYCDKIQQNVVQCASGRSMPTLQFSAVTKDSDQSTPQQPSRIIIPGRLSQLQPSLQAHLSEGSVPLQRRQPVRSRSSGSGQPKQSSQHSLSERQAAHQKVGLPTPTGLVSSKQSSRNNLYGGPVFVQRPPKPIGLTFRDSIPLNALQSKGYGSLNGPHQPSLLPTGTLMHSNQQLNSSLNNSTPSDQQDSRPAQSTAKITLKNTQQNRLGGPVLIERPPTPIGLKFRDPIPLNALQLSRYRGLLNAQY